MSIFCFSIEMHFYLITNSFIHTTCKSLAILNILFNFAVSTDPDSASFNILILFTVQENKKRSSFIWVQNYLHIHDCFHYNIVERGFIFFFFFFSSLFSFSFGIGSMFSC